MSLNGQVCSGGLLIWSTNTIHESCMDMPVCIDMIKLDYVVYRKNLILLCILSCLLSWAFCLLDFVRFVHVARAGIVNQ